MRTRRVLSLLLLLIPLGTLAFMTQKPVYPLVVCVVGLAGARGRFQVDFRRAYHVGVIAAIAAIFTLKWIVFPPLRLGGSSLPFFSIGLVNYSFAYHVAQGLLLYQATLFFFRREDGLPRVLPLYAAISMIMAGTIPSPALSGMRDTVFQSASLALAVVTGLYFTNAIAYRAANGAQPQSGLRVKWAILSALLAFIVASGWAMGTGLYRYGDDVDRFFGDYLAKRDLANSVGFPNDGRFGTISKTKSLAANATALRIFSKDAPGYLRGKVYDTYATTRWETSGQPEPIKATTGEGLPTPPPGARWFALAGESDGSEGSDGSDGADRSSQTNRREAMEICRVVSSGATLFAPLGTAFLCAPVEEVSEDADGALVSSQLSGGTPYEVMGKTEPQAKLDEEERARLLALPDNLDPRIRELALQLTQTCSNDLERISAIVQYLTSNYQYDLEAGPANAKEPVSAFLFDVRKGHCEFFAAAATVLLRSAGVPCRYVNGFVADERNSYGGYWVARNKDAHAWAEAFAEGHGWRLVEATPGSGVPSGETSRLAQLWEFIKYLPSAALAALRNLGLGGAFVRAIEWLGNALVSLPGLLVVGAIAIATILFVRLRLKKRGRTVRGGLDPLAVSMLRLLKAMDKRLAGQGLVRADPETLHRFAQRVSAAGHATESDWYRDYAAFRYGPPPTASQLDELARRLSRAHGAGTQH